VKKLYFLRHGKAAPQKIGQSDKERPLVEFAYTQLEKLKIALSGTDFNPDSVLCSTAERTKQTVFLLQEAGLLANATINFEKSLYNAPLTTVLAEIAKVDDGVQSLLIVGHNPAVAEAVQRFQREKLLISFPTLSLAGFAIEVTSWGLIENSPATPLFTFISKD
jgi:phosphohistidine phosphatase